ncbi:dethiobiotin synthase [Sphingobacteriaceae bacterium]|nr:dethiobiotin synthase [Sphingobacteriaceae bacterium]
MNSLIVAGIGTGIGKTLISAILVEALQADYWKPIQAGDLDQSDTLKVKALISNTLSVFHPESYLLKTPMSPHAAAKIDGIEIELEKLIIPRTENTLVIELAGGLMVPLNSKELNIDLLKKWHVPVVLVSQNYLGSINHTLLSLDLLKTKNIPVMGIIFNGEQNVSTEEFILSYSKVKCLGRIPEIEAITKEEIKKIGQNLTLTI